MPQQLIWVIAEFRRFLNRMFNLKNSAIFNANQIESEDRRIALTVDNSKGSHLELGNTKKRDGHLKVELQPVASTNRDVRSAREGRDYYLIDNQLHKLVSGQRKFSRAVKDGQSRRINVNNVRKRRPVTVREGTRGNRSVKSAKKIVLCMYVCM